MDLHISRKLLSNISLDLQKEHMGLSLVVPWIRIHGPTQGTRAQVPRASRQLGPRATATEPARGNY